MGWTVYYDLKRDAPLTADERGALEAHVAGDTWAWAAEGYQLHFDDPPKHGRIASGFTKLEHDPDSPDIDHLLDLLNELAGKIEGATLEVSDDLETIGWNEDAQRFGWLD
jgi:hypothetical protein